jgi:hypothetical protein
LAERVCMSAISCAEKSGLSMEIIICNMGFPGYLIVARTLAHEVVLSNNYHR